MTALYFEASEIYEVITFQLDRIIYTQIDTFKNIKTHEPHCEKKARWTSC